MKLLSFATRKWIKCGKIVRATSEGAQRNRNAARRRERERGVSSGKDGLYAMHKTEQGFATYKGKSVIVPTMIYDPPSKVVQIFVHRGVHLLEKLVRGVHRLGGNFHRRVTSIIFSMARAYIISSPPSFPR